MGKTKLKINSEWLRHKYVDENLSCQQIAALLKSMDFIVTRQWIWKKLKKLNIKIRSKVDAIFYEDGQRCKVSQGYFWIWKPEHPRANGDYVKRAVLNLEKKLERPLQNGEMPHHIDNNRMNDDPPNLIVTDRSEHGKIHKTKNNGKDFIHDEILSPIFVN